MSKVLVTGATGYIGRHVVRELLDMGHEVTAVDMLDKGLDARATFFNMSIFSGDADIYNQLGKPDVCIHLAWRNGFRHNADSHMRDLSSHITFCENMMMGGLSSLSVMGTMHEVGYWEGAIDEKTPCNPLSQYGIAKNALRQSLFLTSAQYGCQLNWLRAYYITGDDLHSNSVFAKLTQAAQAQKTEFPFTSGKNKYDFIELTDLSRMIAVASLQNEVTGIINLCSGEPMALGERIERFIREKGFNIRLQYGAYPDRTYDSPAVWGDAHKIRQIMQNYEKKA